jgi:hypothetical protein
MCDKMSETKEEVIAKFIVTFLFAVINIFIYADAIHDVDESIRSMYAYNTYNSLCEKLFLLYIADKNPLFYYPLRYALFLK